MLFFPAAAEKKLAEVSVLKKSQDDACCMWRDFDVLLHIITTITDYGMVIFHKSRIFCFSGGRKETCWSHCFQECPRWSLYVTSLCYCITYYHCIHGLWYCLLSFILPRFYKSTNVQWPQKRLFWRRLKTTKLAVCGEIMLLYYIFFLYSCGIV